MGLGIVQHARSEMIPARLWLSSYENRYTSRKLVRKQRHQLRTEVFVKEKFHAAADEASLRSRAAANARVARMSAC